MITQVYATSDRKVCVFVHLCLYIHIIIYLHMFIFWINYTSICNCLDFRQWTKPSDRAVLYFLQLFVYLWMYSQLFAINNDETFEQDPTTTLCVSCSWYWCQYLYSQMLFLGQYLCFTYFIIILQIYWDWVYSYRNIHIHGCCIWVNTCVWHISSKGLQRRAKSIIVTMRGISFIALWICTQTRLIRACFIFLRQILVKF